jgi:hypothetical protein
MARADARVKVKVREVDDGGGRIKRKQWVAGRNGRRSFGKVVKDEWRGK